MCAWPAARRWWGRITHPKPRPAWMPSRWEDTKDQLAWRLEKALTCWMGRHHAKMGSWPFCYRCGKQVGLRSPTMRSFCAWCAVETTNNPDPSHADWCPRR